LWHKIFLQYLQFDKRMQGELAWAAGKNSDRLSYWMRRGVIAGREFDCATGGGTSSLLPVGWACSALDGDEGSLHAWRMLNKAQGGGVNPILL
jgi:hypothetical protein